MKSFKNLNASHNLTIQLQPSKLALAISIAISTMMMSQQAYACHDGSHDSHDSHDSKIEIKAENKIEAKVVIQANRPTSIPTEIPTTIESITAKEITTTINAIDAEDALKYLPSLLVRKRFAGDYNHAVLATRASGTGNSARSLVYADGVLLSNLLGNGASFTPRWGLVTPEEIERVDVLYGPFSAAYSGNSVGAVVDYITRMPKQFEAHAKLVGFSENFQLYGSNKTYKGKQLSIALGNQHGDLSWWLNVNRLDNKANPIAFTNKLASTGIASNAGTAVTGAINDKNPQGLSRIIFGETGQLNTVQDHAKIKLAYNFSPTMRAHFSAATWQNQTNSNALSYLKNAANQAVYSGDVNFQGKKYTLSASDMNNSINQLSHSTYGLHLKNTDKDNLSWEIAASLYDYHKDLNRFPSAAIPTSNNNEKGRVADANGTGWNTLLLKTVWKPNLEHTAEFGYQREAFQLRNLVSETALWKTGTALQRISAFQGNTQLQSVYAQDTWRMNSIIKTIIGGRIEQWQAHHGALSNATSTLYFSDRKNTYFSPKAALSFQTNDELVLKASIGKAVRMPTVSELYQGTVSTNAIVNNDPLLKPELSWTNELSAEKTLNDGKGFVRSTLFFENTKDALYSQTNTLVSPNVTNIQNIDRIKTKGVELAFQMSDVLIRGLQINSSLTFADSRIHKNDKYPISVGKWQPRVPKWRANLVASYSPNEQWSGTLGVRYSGKQFGALDNSDVHASTYFGFSKFLVADIRIRNQINRQWSAALGIDNLNNQKYWAFHNYTQRTVIAELKYAY